MFYIQENDNIILFDESKQKLQNTLKFMPQYAGYEIKESERPIVDFQFADTEEYIAEQAQAEAERIAKLNLTAADVERAIYKAKGLDFDDVIALVEQTNEAASLNEDGTAESAGIDIKALKIELKANNFYRGNPYIDAVGTLLGFSKQQLDLFFETNDYTKLITNDETANTDSDSDTDLNSDTDIDTNEDKSLGR